MGFGFRPDDEDIGDGRIGNPHFRTAQAISAGDLFGTGLHSARIGAGIRFGQAETADQLAGDETGQVFLLLFVRAISEDRMDDERGLHAHHRAITAVDALHLTRYKAIGHIAGICGAIFFRQGDAEQAGTAHQAEQFRFGGLGKIGLGHTRHKFRFAEGCGGVADHPLVVGQLVFQQKRVLPIECCAFAHVMPPDLLAGLFVLAPDGTSHVYSFLHYI